MIQSLNSQIQPHKITMNDLKTKNLKLEIISGQGEPETKESTLTQNKRR